MNGVDDTEAGAPAFPFTKVLIANRGEIACRILRTLRRSGIGSVAIHHAAEAGARHARMADEAVEITGETPVAAHLDGRQIIDAALRCGADAIHPGYGFLSENARLREGGRGRRFGLHRAGAETIASDGRQDLRARFRAARRACRSRRP